MKTKNFMFASLNSGSYHKIFEVWGTLFESNYKPKTVDYLWQIADKYLWLWRKADQQDIGILDVFA